MATTTKGNVIVENIKVGNIHYEFEYCCGIKCEVITLPIRDENGTWRWKSRNMNNDNIIDYAVTEEMSHYSPNLYDYEAYKVKYWL